MIELGVVAHDIIHVIQRTQGRDLLQQIVSVRGFYRVDKRRLFVAHQIGVVGAAALGVVTMKIADHPIHVTDPVDVFPKCNVHGL